MMVFADLSLCFHLAFYDLSWSFPKLCDPQRLYGNQALAKTEEKTLNDPERPPAIVED